MDEPWRCTFTNQPVWKKDRKIEYSVMEDPVPADYPNPQISQIGGYEFVIRNRHENKSDVLVFKFWEDDEDASGTRPDKVTFTLYCNGRSTGKTLELTPDTGWAGGFYNLKRRSGELLNDYSVQETPVSGYTTVIEETETLEQRESGIFIFRATNSYEDIVMKIPVLKIWADGGESHDPVTVTLYRNGSSTGKTLELTPDTGWAGTFTDLERYDESGVPYSYTITEAGVPSGYESSVNPASISGDDASGTGFTVTNAQLGDITVEKEWIGDDDCRADTRPTSVKVRLIADREEVKSAELTADGNWETVFEDCPLYRIKSDGSVVRINYSVREEPVPGYQGGIPYRDPADRNRFIILNTLIRTDVGVKKIWPLVPHEELPEEITVILLSDWAEEGVMAEVARHTLTPLSSENDHWAYTFRDQPVWKKNRKIRYSVEENPVPSGYRNPWTSKTDEYHFVIRNRHENQADVLVSKSWEDEEDVFGTRPDKVTFTLYCNGKSTGKTVELTPDTDWAGEFLNLERKTGELLNVYSVRETSVDGYTTVIEETETPAEREEGIFIFQATNTLKTCTITYDPNGGTIDGSKDPVSEEHLYGEEITIRNEPVRDGYYFTYWKGSKYHPGDSYTVTGDHTFVAQWMRDDPRIFSFTFTKKWVGKTEDSLSWTLYYPDGRVRHKGFKKKVVSDTEWQYTAWFDSLEDYYLIEDVPPNYKVRYSNIGIHADETDRLYNGGTVYNYYIPKTSDNSGVLLYLGAVLLGCGLLGGVVLVRKRKRSGR
jgi:LPXTG-motif cell wall-anchored protein